MHPPAVYTVHASHTQKLLHPCATVCDARAATTASRKCSTQPCLQPGVHNIRSSAAVSLSYMTNSAMLCRQHTFGVGDVGAALALSMTMKRHIEDWFLPQQQTRALLSCEDPQGCSGCRLLGLRVQDYVICADRLPKSNYSRYHVQGCVLTKEHTCEQMAVAVALLSPVTTMRRMPAALHSLMAPLTSFLGGSCMPTIPIQVRSASSSLLICIAAK